MIILEGDNRILTTAQKYTYTETNYSSDVSSLTVLNATDSSFAANAFLLLGNFGVEEAEIVKIATVNSNTGVITLAAPTVFSHSESTRVTVIPYNQIRFYHTTTTTFDIGTATDLSGKIDLQPSDWFTTYSDESNSTGYGWYLFYNSVTDTYSQESNSIPYAGFDTDTTENILADFFSMLNNKELQIVTREDALSWASEGYGRMRNKLNLTNTEFTSSALSTIAIVADTIEYDLETDFDHLVSITSGLDTTDPGKWGGNKRGIPFISLSAAYTYNGTDTRYYIRGNKIGFLPTPQASATYHYLYLKRGSRLTLNTDEVDLPNGGEYVIKDYMLYRAYQKFQNPIHKVYFEAFTNGLNDMIISSIKKDASLAAWGIEHSSNV
jgi:hypothetical protein